jgi:Zn-dependent peptidase ImmA (M78 family)
MWVIVNGTNSTEIEDSVVERVLNLYPEEQLLKRKVFQNAFTTGSIKLSDLKDECDKLLIPWQMFLLDTENHKRQIEHIEKTRADKISARLLAKRKGSGDVTSKRIIDRLIRLQGYVSTTTSLPKNPYCDSLKGRAVKVAAKYVVDYFKIDQNWFWSPRGKGTALTKLISLVEAKNINVCQGVLQNKMLPHHSVVTGDVYKNTSGFSIKDDKVPFVFLPSEINPDEVESRQIFTLVYLLVIIGLGKYDYYLEKDFSTKMVGTDRISRRIFDITTEILIPESETDKLRGRTITVSMRDELASKFKVSPSALVTTLRIRKVITKPEYNALMPEKYKPGTRKPGPMNTQKISTSVQKFCGRIAVTHVNKGIRKGGNGGGVESIQAQYMLFGAVNKPHYHDYRKQMGL